MPDFDLLDCINQKYAPTAPLTSTNVQGALDEIAPQLGGAGVPEAPVVDASYFRNGSLGGGAADWSLLLKGYGETPKDLGSIASGSIALSVDTHNEFVATLTGASGPFAVTADKLNSSATLTLTISGSFAVDTNGVSWGTAGPPPMTDGKTYIIGVFTKDTGTTWLGVWSEF